MYALSTCDYRSHVLFCCSTSTAISDFILEVYCPFVLCHKGKVKTLNANLGQNREGSAMKEFNFFRF